MAKNKKRNSIICWIAFLIIVLVIVLIAFPKYKKIDTQFKTSQARMLVAKLTTLSATNYVQRKAVSTLGYSVNNCTDIMNIYGGTLPSGYKIDNKKLSPDDIGTCYLQEPKGEKVEFNVIGIN